ncbi:MAG: RecB family exonuclease [Solirubrobacteraceae bacterium]
MSLPASPLRQPQQARGEVRFWRCRDERAEALAVAAEIERLVFREHLPPQQIVVMLARGSLERPVLGKALQERAIPHATEGSAAALRRAEVRDAIAWLRLLLDARDASAAARTLLRPPIEMRHVDLAQVVQIARRRRLDIVAALPSCLESPQVPPEARERITRFLRLHSEASAAMREMTPTRFLEDLLESIGLHRGSPLSAEVDLADRAASGAWLHEIAAAFERRLPWAPARELALALVSSESGEDGLQAPRRDRRSGELGAVELLAFGSSPRPDVEHAYLLGLSAPRAAEQGSGQTPADASALEPASEAIAELLELRLSSLVVSHSDRSAGAIAAVESLRRELGAEWEEPRQAPANPNELIEAALRTMRQELLDGVASIGGRLGELRLDTDVDVSHGVVRYLELVKLAALLERPPGQEIEEALSDVNNRLLAAVTPLQREILESSTLDEELLEGRAGRDQAASSVGRAAAGEPALRRFLPRRGEGLLLSASDVQTYRSCPLRYKFARVLRIPADPTLNQRFGIAVHQVLERYHADGGGEQQKLLALLDDCWHRAGFSESEQEQALRSKARSALRRYHARLDAHASTPLWFERSFAFRLGRHHVRGRVDRVDRLPDGTYELIDYKTGRPRSEEQLREDIQLSLYALAARECWQLERSRESYYYLLDDEKVPLPDGGPGLEWVRETVSEVGDAIMQERFEPTPSKVACSICDYRIACPVAEQ